MALPASLTLITVTASFLAGDGTAETGSVEFSNAVTLINTTTDEMVSPIYRRVNLSGGLLTVQLPATDDPDWEPVDWTWQVTQQLGSGGTRQYSISLPYDGGPVDLADVAPVDPSAGTGGGGGGSGVQSVNGDSGPDVVLTASEVGAAAEVHVHAGADITTGTVAVGRLPTGTGGSQVALGNHNHDAAYAELVHTHAGEDVDSGTIDSDRLDVGTGGDQVAAGDHNHDADYAELVHAHAGTDITSGTVATARLDVGTSSGQVSAGDHNHNAAYAAISHAHAGADITSGTVAFARLPVGTTSTTVSQGDHNHDTRYYTETELNPGSWNAPSLVTNVTDAGSPYANAGSRLEPLYNIIRLRGRLNIGASFLANATLATLAVGNRPATEQVYSIRTGGTGAGAAFMTITTAGLVSITVSSVSGAWVQLDGFEFPAP